jgi:uncharacterized iron-regulated membrane protein
MTPEKARKERDAAWDAAIEAAADVGGDAAVAALLRQDPDAGSLKIQMTRQGVRLPIRALKKGPKP